MAKNKGAKAPGKTGGKKLKKKLTKKQRIVILVVELVVLLLIVLGFASLRTVSKIDFEKALTNETAGVNADIAEEVLENMEGYTTIALFGLDNRDSSNYKAGNSDTMIIACINNETKEIKLLSLYRDTYLNVGNDKYAKANSAFQRGGVTQAVQMLNANLDLSVKDYVCVDWKALVETIDALDGLDIEITDKEKSQINKYLHDVVEMTGYTSDEVTSSGVTHLNGCQAVTYARIRKTAGDDYLRTARQRIILQKMLEKAKKADIGTLTKICNDVFDDISTDLSLADIIALATSVSKFDLSSTTGFPFDLTTATIDKADYIVPVDMAGNVSKLHEYLFEEADYIPSTSVQNISQTIISQTGVSEDAATIDTSLYNETVGAEGTEAAKEHNKEEKENSQETSTEASSGQQ